MSFVIKSRDVCHADAQILITGLSHTLVEITGDSGKQSFNTESFNSEKNVFLIVYLNDQPVGCGALREIDSTQAELKRMYSIERGAGSAVLAELELRAIAGGFRKMILSTRRKNSKAVTFYQAKGYIETQPYGRYTGRPESICFSKVLTAAECIASKSP